MVEQVIKLFTHFIRTKCSIAHLWSILSVSPAFVWVFWHLFCWQCIVGMTLVAWSIVKHEEACGKAMCLQFNNADSLVSLLQQVLWWKISITIFSGLEDNLSLAAIKVNTSLMQQIWECKTLTHCHLVDGPIQKFGIQISSEKGLLPFNLVHAGHFCGSRNSCGSHCHKTWTCHELQGSVRISLFEAHQNCLVANFHCHCYPRSPFTSRTCPTTLAVFNHILPFMPIHIHTLFFPHTSNLIFEATVELYRYLFLVPWNQVSLGFLVLQHNQQHPQPWCNHLQQSQQATAGFLGQNLHLWGWRSDSSHRNALGDFQCEDFYGSRCVFLELDRSQILETLKPPEMLPTKCMRAQDPGRGWACPPSQWCKMETTHQASCL